MKHVVFVIGNYKNGGVAMRSTNLANAFAEKGYNVTILVTKTISENVFFEHHKNVDIVGLSEYIKKHNNDKIVVKYLKKQQFKIRVIKWVGHITGFFNKFNSDLAEKVKSIRKSQDLSVFVLNNKKVYI